MIRATQALTNRAFNVNVFCHRPATANAAVEAAWIARFRPEFSALGAEPPGVLREIYQTFRGNAAMTALLLETRPAIVSFHFGLPEDDQVKALKQAGIILFGSATSIAEAQKLADAGLDAIVAQGYEAGGHRGAFDENAPDDRLGTFALTHLLAKRLNIPVIAAGGIMDGAGISAALKLGAAAAQLGTAFVGCPESAADQGYRAALASEAANHTQMTRAISGRPARCLANRFTAAGRDHRRQGRAQLSDHLRSGQGAARGGKSQRRIRLRGAMGRPGRAAVTPDAGRRSGQGAGGGAGSGLANSCRASRPRCRPSRFSSLARAIGMSRRMGSMTIQK